MSIVYSCKKCGASLEIIQGKNTCQCNYCQSYQTIPLADDDKKITKFNRAT